MLKYLKTFYDFLMKLKQYHAVHVMILPAFAYFIFLAWLFLSSGGLHYEHLNQDELHMYFFGLGWLIIILFGIASSSFFLALFIEIVILVRQYFTREKIVIKWKFILKNPVYNFIYLPSLFLEITLLLILLYGLINVNISLIIYKLFSYLIPDLLIKLVLQYIS